MHAEALRHREESDDWLMPVLLALALHVGLGVLIVLAGLWEPDTEQVSVAGPVVEAALVVTTADVVRAEESAEAAPPPEPVRADPEPQPLPEPQPQDAPDELQPQPQEMIPEPDTVAQDAVADVVEDPTQPTEDERREERRIQDQVDLTERERQAEAERRQRRIEQLEAVRRERAEAARREEIEQQRLQQIIDAQAARRPQPVPDDRPAVQAGNEGTDDDLRARYALALKQTAHSSWNTSLAPEAVACKVRFTQVPPGEVIDVQFLSCPFDGPARESVERALRRGHMPYEGFARVFERTVDITFCHPQEACPR